MLSYELVFPPAPFSSFDKKNVVSCFCYLNKVKLQDLFIFCSYFRYSREVGSTQINLPGLPASIDVRHSSLNQRISSAELSGRYHPDPTCR